MADHDLSYKHLFSHHEMVRDLFEGFVREDWVAQLNLHSPQKDNASYVSDTLRARRGDMVWEVPLADGLASLHVLLEFQSTVDTDMAVRMLSYASLRYQDRLEPYQPQMRYLLIDIARYQKDELARMRNLVASMFRLENSSTSEDVDEVTGDLHEWWENAARASLRNAFIKWLDRVIIPRYLRDPSTPNHDLKEKNMSLAEAAEDWRAKYRGEGRLEGRLEGQLNGERQILERQLRKRFGELPPAVTQRLQQAQTEELERWAERLDARNLTELFADNAVEA
jgi:predicted transposase YdaD